MIIVVNLILDEKYTTRNRSRRDLLLRLVHDRSKAWYMSAGAFNVLCCSLALSDNRLQAFPLFLLISVRFTQKTLLLPKNIYYFTPEHPHYISPLQHNFTYLAKCLLHLHDSVSSLGRKKKCKKEGTSSFFSTPVEDVMFGFVL